MSTDDAIYNIATSAVSRCIRFNSTLVFATHGLRRTCYSQKFIQQCRRHHMFNAIKRNGKDQRLQRVPVVNRGVQLFSSLRCIHILTLYGKHSSRWLCKRMPLLYTSLWVAPSHLCVSDYDESLSNEVLFLSTLLRSTQGLLQAERMRVIAKLQTRHNIGLSQLPILPSPVVYSLMFTSSQEPCTLRRARRSFTRDRSGLLMMPPIHDVVKWFICNTDTASRAFSLMGATREGYRTKHYIQWLVTRGRPAPVSFTFSSSPLPEFTTNIRVTARMFMCLRARVAAVTQREIREYFQINKSTQTQLEVAVSRPGDSFYVTLTTRQWKRLTTKLLSCGLGVSLVDILRFMLSIDKSLITRAVWLCSPCIDAKFRTGIEWLADWKRLMGERRFIEHSELAPSDWANLLHFFAARSPWAWPVDHQRGCWSSEQARIMGNIVSNQISSLDFLITSADEKKPRDAEHEALYRCEKV